MSQVEMWSLLLTWTVAGMAGVGAALAIEPTAPLWAETDRMPLWLRVVAVLGMAVAWPSTLALVAREGPRRGRHR